MKQIIDRLCFTSSSWFVLQWHIQIGERVIPWQRPLLRVGVQNITDVNHRHQHCSPLGTHTTLQHIFRRTEQRTIICEWLAAADVSVHFAGSHRCYSVERKLQESFPTVLNLLIDLLQMWNEVSRETSQPTFDTAEPRGLTAQSRWGERVPPLRMILHSLCVQQVRLSTKLVITLFDLNKHHELM